MKIKIKKTHFQSLTFAFDSLQPDNVKSRVSTVDLQVL